MNENPRAEAERLLGVAEKLLQSRDLNGTRDFALLAQEAEPLLDGIEQILAVADVLLAANRRINNHHDWYAILQVDRRSNDLELIKKQYRRLALLLHPDKNKFAFSDQAFKLVADAWAVLADSGKKALYDNELNLYSKVDLSNSAKLPVRRTQPPRSTARKSDQIHTPNSTNTTREESRPKVASFWTTCPYCYVLYEYPRVYQDCCLKCQNCERAFHGALLPAMPPLVPGKDAYYCSWGFFPLGFALQAGDSGEKTNNAAAATAGFPSWMPPVFSTVQQQAGDKNPAATAAASGPTPIVSGFASGVRGGGVGIPSGGHGRGAPQPQVGPRKRGRPRKIVV